MHQRLKNAEEELARHHAVIDQRKVWDREVIEGVRSGRYQVESGDGRRVDQGRNSDNSQDNVPPWLARQRDDALRTVDRYTRSDHLNAPAADRLDALVRASGTKIDPAGIGARYLAAVGLPAYNSAFGKILADPMHGHLRFSPEEVEAVRVVSAVQTERALNEGTGSAGLFAIPFTLDPSIVISNTGALNPYRAISRIETIATKNGAV